MVGAVTYLGYYDSSIFVQADWMAAKTKKLVLISRGLILAEVTADQHVLWNPFEDLSKVFDEYGQIATAVLQSFFWISWRVSGHKLRRLLSRSYHRTLCCKFLPGCD